MANFHGELECELPNPHLYTFVGNMHIPQRGSDAPVKLPLHPSQVTDSSASFCARVCPESLAKAAVVLRALLSN